jgi:hypothetical protein
MSYYDTISESPEKAEKPLDKVSGESRFQGFSEEAGQRRV